MKLFFSAVLFCCSLGLLPANDIQERLEKLISAENTEALLRDGCVQRTIYRDDLAKPELTPRLDDCRDAIEFWEGDVPAFLSETLYYYPKKATLEGSGKNDTELVSKIIRSLSRLEGIEYYSTSRKKMRTLYEKSFVVDNEKSRNRIDDPTSGPADGLSLFAVQKDLTFGEYLYRYTYRQTEHTTGFHSQNEESLSYTFVRLIKPRKLRVSLIIHDMGDAFLVYNLTRIDFLAIPGIEGKIQSSFSTRARAMYDWFIREYERNN